jgi:tripartite-type tricarboxylate transporter receptor subunit TctC
MELSPAYGQPAQDIGLIFPVQWDFGLTTRQASLMPRQNQETPLGNLFRRAAIAALVLMPLALPAAAAFPDRPIHIIVPTTVGGGADTLARMVGAKLSERLGQGVVIENLPGANGMIGMGKVAKAEPDGYTLALTFTDHFINPSLYKNQPYDLLTDFAPVVYLGALPFVVTVSPEVPAKSIAELVALAKDKPGALNFASAGTGGALHLAGELFKVKAGVQMTHVPYKGTSAALPDLMSGRVQVIFTSAISVKSHAEAGRLRLLATTGAARSPDLPDLPTVQEAGVPGYVSGIWYGIVAPAKTSRAVVDKLNAEVTAIVSAPDFKKAMIEQGVSLAPGTPEAFGEFYRSEIVKWATVIKEAGLGPTE